MSTILLVDPTGSKTQGLEVVCDDKDLHFKITVVDSVANAIASLESNKFDMLICDPEIELINFIVDQDNPPVTNIITFDDQPLKIAQCIKKYIWSNKHQVSFTSVQFDPGIYSTFYALIRSLA